MTSANSPQNRPVNDIRDVSEALRLANQARGEWMLSVAEGLMSVDDLIAVACNDDGRPLRKLRLEQVIAAQPDVSLAEAKRQVASISRISGYKDDKPMLVGWLIDARSQGTRIDAWVDASTPREIWTGFPFTSQPASRRQHQGQRGQR